MDGRTRRGDRGYTLLELLIAVAILSVIGAATARVVSTTTEAYGTGQLATDVETRLGRTLDRIAWELRSCSPGVMLPTPAAPFSTSSLTYQKPSGFLGGATNWGSPCRIEFRLEAGELDDGADNDGDGLVDEGDVVWVTNSGLVDESESVGCHGVSEFLEGEEDNLADDNGNGLEDEAGLAFDFEGDVLTIRLTLQKRSPDGTLITRTGETSVKLRNP